jgi:hypothetical protein
VSATNIGAALARPFSSLVDSEVILKFGSSFAEQTTHLGLLRQVITQVTANTYIFVKLKPKRRFVPVLFRAAHLFLAG